MEKYMDFLKLHKQIYSSGYKHQIIPFQKLEQMQTIYLAKGNNTYSQDQKEIILNRFSVIRFKCILANCHLEELWALSMAHRFKLLDLIENSIKKLTWDNEDLIIGSKCLESFLFQACSLLDIYMFYICLIMNIQNPGKMTEDKFIEKMNKIQDPKFISSGKALKEYFSDNVFKNGEWGNSLKSLRNKVAHFDRLKPSLEGNENVLGVHLDWPTIKSLTFERLIQEFDNGIFNLLKDTSPLLFNLEWKSGPYKENLWS